MITTPSLDTIEAQILAFYRVRFPGRDTGRESFLGKLARAHAMAILGLCKSVEDADRDAIPSAKTSTAALDAFAVLFGLPSTSGGFGRSGAVAASGGAAPITGTTGTVVGSNEPLVASDGVTQFELVTGVTAPDSGTIAAVTTGTAGNLPVGSVLTWVSPPAGLDSTITLTTKTSGGVNGESDAALLARLLTRLQDPPKGGIANDWRTWAEEVSGVARAYVYPLRSGLGNTDVVVTKPGSGQARRASTTTVLLVGSWLDDHRPVTSWGQALKPYMPDYPTGGLTVKCRLVPSKSAYNFDWIDTATSYTVDTYTPGTPATLKLNTLAPASLKAAIDSYAAGAAAAPRLQVCSTSTDALAVNAQVRATAYSDGGGKTTLTLENPLPDLFVAPQASDKVWAGGPMVDTIAAALLDYVDGLGPSRQGGYASPMDAWEDTCAIARLTQICLDGADSDGTRFASNIVAGGVTIALGNAAANTIDVQAADSDPSGPDLLWARTIAVTQ